MTVYLITSISLVILGLIYEATNRIANDLHKKNIPLYFYIIPSFFILFFISTFRGDMTTDYVNNTRLFHKINSFEFFDSFIYGPDREFFYVLLNRTIGLFTDNPIFLFGITTIIILFGFYHQFSKYSVNVWLSVLMFVTAGSYYASFNITRQIMAVAIIFMGSKFLYERKFFKYLLVVIAAALVHKSSIVMILFYFILHVRINLRNLMLIFIGSVVSVLFFDGILDILQTFFYSNYDEESYGMTGQAVTNVVLPLAFILFSIFHLKKLDPENIMHRVWFNAVYYYALFNILALQVQMVERLGRYFAPYALLLIPFIFSKMKNKHLRFIYIMILIFLLIVYNYAIFVDDPVFDPYYFYWNN